jgi:DNA-binding transcriptional LysR family regulator
VASEIVRGVRDGIADLGVCWDAGDLGGLATLRYRSDHLSVVVPAGHPLTRRKRVAFVDTLPYEQVEILAGSIVQLTLRRAAAVAGQTIRHRNPGDHVRRRLSQRCGGARDRDRAA